MRKFAYVFVGVVLFTAAAGVLGYRLMSEPAWQERYVWLTGAENAARPASEAMRPQGGDSAQMRTQVQRGEGRQSAREQLNNMKLLQLGLDVANVLVGIVGIYLTLSGMRMRREARA